MVYKVVFKLCINLFFILDLFLSYFFSLPGSWIFFAPFSF